MFVIFPILNIVNFLQNFKVYERLETQKASIVTHTSYKPRNTQAALFTSQAKYPVHHCPSTAS